MQTDMVIGQFPRWGSPRSPLERGQVAVLLTLAALTAAAWALTIRLGHAMHLPMGAVANGVPDADAAPHAHHAGMLMHDAGEVAAVGMSGASWSPAGFALFVVAWAVMMAAMMFPGVAPMLLLVHAVARRGARGSEGMSAAVFAAGYLLVWTAVGAITWVAAHVMSGSIERLGAAERATWSPLALGAALVLAGLYQLSPVKTLCLDHCRSPVAFVVGRWRPGRAGALWMGIGHGLHCLGCCAALFVVLVATGVMSLAWMLLLSLIDFAEKALPMGRLSAKAVGVAFLAMGVLVATGRFALPSVA